MNKVLIPVLAVAAVALVIATGVRIALKDKNAMPVGSAGAIDSVNYHCWAGVCEYFASQSMAVASSTCSTQSPAATSTLILAAARVSKSSTGATLQYEWGTSANPNATTTSLGLGTIASAAQGTVLASTTNANTGLPVDPKTVLAPNTYVTLKIGSSTPTDQAGSCYFKFTALQ